MHAALDGAGLGRDGLDDEIGRALLADDEIGAGEELLEGLQGLELALDLGGADLAELVGAVHDARPTLLHEELQRRGRGLRRDVELHRGGEREDDGEEETTKKRQGPQPAGGNGATWGAETRGHDVLTGHAA